MNSFKTLPKNIKTLIVSLMIISAGLLVSNIVLFKKINAIKNPNANSEVELKKVVADVGKYIVLPEGETPTLATVSDPEKLKDQKFFVNSEAGDKVLIYQVSQKAILWRPSTKKIIEISALSIKPVDNEASPNK